MVVCPIPVNHHRTSPSQDGMLDESPGLEVSDPFIPVTCALGEPALTCGKDGAPLLDLSGPRAGSEHRAQV